MFNYIILAILGVVFLLGIILTVTENFIQKNSASGRFLRKIRIVLREKSFTSFCLITSVLLIFGLIIGETNWLMLFAAIGILFATLIVALPHEFFGIRRSRKKAHLKKQSNSLLSVKEVPELPMMTEIIPSGEN